MQMKRTLLIGGLLLTSLLSHAQSPVVNATNPQQTQLSLLKHRLDSLSRVMSLQTENRKKTELKRYESAKNNIIATTAVINACQKRLTFLAANVSTVRRGHAYAQLTSPTNNSLRISIIEQFRRIIGVKTNPTIVSRVGTLLDGLSANALVKNFPVVNQAVSLSGMLVGFLRGVGQSDGTGATPAQIAAVEKSLQPTLNYFLTLDTLRNTNQAALNVFNTELEEFEIQLNSATQPYCKLAVRSNNISAYSARTQVMLDTITTRLEQSFREIGQSFDPLSSTILSPPSRLVVANNTGDEVNLLVQRLRKLTIQLDEINRTYSQGVRHVIEQASSSGITTPTLAKVQLKEEAEFQKAFEAAFKNANKADQMEKLSVKMQPAFVL
jgi:hypothetical protein